MSRLRVRHWLAVTLAFILIVVAYRAEVTVDVAATDLAGASNIAAVATADQMENEETPSLSESGVFGPGVVSGGFGDQGRSGEPLTTAPAVPLGPPLPALGPVAPLTGLPALAADVARSAMVIKVDNHPRARPQTGLDQADIVFDLRAEGITRFAAVFQSNIPEPVGPVRSSRTSDFDLLRGFDTPIYGSSGGNDHVTNGLRGLPIVELTNRTRNEYFRDFSRPAPHNLYINGSDLYDLAPTDLPNPQPWFEYRLSLIHI